MENTHLKVATWIANLLDNRFSIGKFGVGIEPIIGLVPVIGDIITLALSGYLIWIASIMGAPQELRNKMLRNVVVDFVIGMVPFIGDVGDFFFRANTRNLKMLREWAEGVPMEGEVIASRRMSAAT